MKKIFAVLLMLMLMVTLGCKGNKEKIIGKWTLSSYSVEFLENGAFLMSVPNFGNVEGKWELQGDDVMKMEIEGDSNSSKISFPNDDTMIMTSSKGTDTFTRIKEQDGTVSNASADQQTTTGQNKYRMVSAEDAIQISIKTLNEEYQANKFKADSKYKGKLLLVTGKIFAIGQDMFSDAPTVVLSDPESQLKTLACKFESKETPVLANLTVGQTITVAGYCGEGMLGPDLFNTVVQ